MNMDDLGGVISEVVLEKREFEAPWGMPGVKVTGTVLRATHPEWRQYVLEVQASRPAAIKSREAVNERIFSGLAPKGFRSKPKTEPEAHSLMLRKVAEAEKLQIDVFTLREQKPGIAKILCLDLKINGESEVQRGGKTYHLDTPEGREGFLNHEIWEFEDGGEKKYFAVGLYKRDADGNQILDKEGEPVKNEEGGWNFGDGLASLITAEAENQAKFVEVRKANALEQSAGSSPGSSESGVKFHLKSAAS